MKNIALAMIVRDGLMPWKRTMRVLRQAKERGWETVVAVDTRSTDGTRAAVAPYTDILIDFDNSVPSCDPAIDMIVHASSKKFVLLNSDDEEPSPDLWKFCEHPFADACYGVMMVCPIPGHRVYLPGTEYQMRLIMPSIWRWTGGIAGTDEVAGDRRVQMDLILWHFATYAPREFREQKLVGYKTQGASDEYGKRHFWEEYPEEAFPMSPRHIRQFPQE